jgi:hypothetical protein
MKKKRMYKEAFDVGITWIDLRTIFKLNIKWSQFWLGICHLTNKVYMWTPLDFKEPTMITTIDVSPTENYCEVATECINFKCPLNRFNKEVFLTKFSDIGAASLGLPANFGENPIWFNDPESEYNEMWAKILHAGQMYPEGGRIEFSEEMWENYDEQ